MNQADLYVMPSERWSWCALMPFLEQVRRAIA
jgi:hypothetical protein